MEMYLSETTRKFVVALLLLILPWVALLAGLAVGLQNAWYYLLCILWFGCGIIFFGALE